MKINRYFLVTIIIILVVILHQLGWLFFIGKVTLPFQRVFFRSEKIHFENNKFQQEIEKLTLENIKLKLLEEENERLKNELGFVKKDSYQRVVANIVGKRTESGLTWFILDQGEKKGIKAGQAVVIGDVIIGKVMKTTKYFSYFLPLFDERIALAALTISRNEKIKEKNKASGIVRGKWGIILEMDWIPLTKKINSGDYVITSGLEEEIPKGLLIGKVEVIESKPGALFQKAIIEPEKKIEELEIVSVIIK